ncbi:MAG: S1 RNA-binding domain-containing protein [Eubacterium sp.]|nr:S1 RNA-binding domain-containing protein [Eubacterium sp.]
MLSIGKKQKLQVVSCKDFGIYLAEEPDASKEERVLLPKAQVPEGTSVGDELEVFLYRDSEDRPIATTREPRFTLGEVALLKVREVTKIGAFLDWGLEKDLFLPYREQTGKLKAGDDVLAALYLDKSERLCATMKIYHYLALQSPYTIGDEVTGRIYERSRRFGVFVAVDDRYSALIPAREAQDVYLPGQVMQFRVTEVKEDGKLSVSARKKAYLQIDEDADRVLEEIVACDGELPFDDKASPEVIASRFGLSKAAFKRAVGHLLKEKKIAKEEGCLILLK